ncbi:hypothetical protein PHMEG_00010576 [Phytophthora megakarya]|uniref:Uncharacterized protein n=1 Tax=Phytophthora megakarya TaxID=4795 RepID=A0A225WF33_9STRA|nr:hypothetical protein PHMEG_00010576 [Phytophthora megakarya]
MGEHKFSLFVIGEHEVATSELERTGLDKRIEVEVDNLLLGGAPPKRAHLMSKGPFDISTLVQLMEWVGSKECTTSEQFHRYSEGNDFSLFSDLDSNYHDELIVLHTFTMNWSMRAITWNCGN